MGNSAMDIATELSHVAERTLLSVRRGSWIVPKRLLGKPADQVVKPWAAVHVPWQIRQPVAQFLLRITVGPPERLGLPAPERGLFQDHPTITDTVPSRIAHGAITPVGAIDALDGERVRFADGREEPVDAIVWCTGYRVEIPFLDDAADRPRPAGAAALQARAAPRRRRPAVRRADAVDRARRSRSSSARPSWSPSA